MKKIFMLFSCLGCFIVSAGMCKDNRLPAGNYDIAAKPAGESGECVIPGVGNIKKGEKHHSLIAERDCDIHKVKKTSDNVERFEAWCTSEGQPLCVAAQCKNGHYLEGDKCFLKSNSWNCVVRDMSAFSFKISNEYLFPTTAHYNNREALICGGFDKNNCNNNQMVIITGTHVHQNITITDPKIYKCATEGGNLWRDGWNSGLPGCASLENRTLVTTFGDKDIYVLKSERAYGLSGSTYYVTNDVCYAVRGQEVKPEPKPEPKPKPKKKTCKEGRSTPEGKACCDLPPSVATWDDPNCNCVDTNKQFSIVDGKGACIVPQAKVDDKYTCSSLDLSLINLWKTTCKDSQMVLQLIQEFETMCTNSNLTVAEYNKISNQVSLAVELNCQPKIEEEKKDVEEKKPDPNLQSRAAIIAAGGMLDKIASSLDVNVWKDKDGKFNTARLASDSIAAVVLGTAGGLITSSVMKKHQVEDGFEDLKCTIGGQPVAGWGDEFTVGIQ